jgi:ribosomal protein L7/L12
LFQVEKAPTVVKSGLKKEEAEELQKKLEAGVFSSQHAATWFW